MNEYYKDLKNAPALSGEDQLALYLLSQQGDKEARNKLIESCLRFVVLKVRKHAQHLIKTDFDGYNELISESNLNIINVIDNGTWNPDKGKLTTYLGMVIENGIKAFRFKVQHRGVYLPLSTRKAVNSLLEGKKIEEVGKSKNRQQNILGALAVSNTTSLANIGDGNNICKENKNQEEQLCLADIHRSIKYIVNLLDRKIFKQRYGIDCDILSTEELTKLYGYNECRIAISRAKSDIKKHLRPNCQNCGEEFTKDFFHRHYCSKECYHEYRNGLKKVAVCKRCGKKFIKTLRNKKKVFCSKFCNILWWAVKHRRRGKKKKNCLYCGKEFFSNYNHRTRGHKCCSKKCAMLRIRQKQLVSSGTAKLVDGKFLYTKICKMCGKNFDAVSIGSNNSKYCSPNCKKQTLPLLICDVCGEEFHAKNPKTRLCSPECIRIDKITTAPKQCPVCNKVFHPKPKKQESCSKICAAKLRKQRIRC